MMPSEKETTAFEHGTLAATAVCACVCVSASPQPPSATSPSVPAASQSTGRSQIPTCCSACDSVCRRLGADAAIGPQLVHSCLCTRRHTICFSRLALQTLHRRRGVSPRTPPACSAAQASVWRGHCTTPPAHGLWVCVRSLIPMWKCSKCNAAPQIAAFWRRWETVEQSWAN